jgi:NAD(P)-dependent dehydrogenase (short-subunit alcohol dehydrogenase family)
MFRSDLLKDRRILVTGGGTGLGAEMASRFASLGASLVLVGRRAEPLAQTAERLRAESGAAVRTLVCDLREPASVEAMLERAWADGPPDTLVNNAAANFIAQTEMLSVRAIDAILATTLHGTLYVTHGLGRRWIDAGTGGTVLSLLSTSVRTGRAFTVPSAVAKAGILAMTRSLATEWGPKGIRLVGIEPGPFPTPGAWRQLMPESRRAQGGSSTSRNPLGRVGQHEELTQLAAYLVSREAGYVNGETVAIDGGAHLRTSGAEDLFDWTDADWDAHRARRG